ncbi:hypothetical protein HII31_04083 [Pseudocercospora fuligena]|uniref:MYND-type domain-containing protein n=1 Tax=Pseudocercospora fuligena TaxID=685502 RepID=A0A8H6VLB2_9PEZI|nr:hypothetical protein HII31_04083 [Pseudocercospora fuligena]
MGGWALQLFCSDWDLDLVQEFDKDCGLLDLEIKHGRNRLVESDAESHRQEEHNMWRNKDNVTLDGVITRVPALPKKNENGINFSMFEKLCSHPEKVRAYLDSSGALSKKFKALRNDARTSEPERLRDPYGPGYFMCILGACGMTLGARLSELDREAMEKYYKDCGLMRDAVKQIGDALDPDTGYVNGCPWDFVSSSHAQTVADKGAPKEDLIFPGTGMINIWAPDHGRATSDMKNMQGHVMKWIAIKKPNVDDLAQTLASLYFDPYARSATKISSTKADSRPQDFVEMAKGMVAKYPNFSSRSPKTGKNECAVCGAGKCGDGKPLMACSKCKRIFYCSKQCQKKDWKSHKVFCSLFDTTS